MVITIEDINFVPVRNFRRVQIKAISDDGINVMQKLNLTFA